MSYFDAKSKERAAAIVALQNWFISQDLSQYEATMLACEFVAVMAVHLSDDERELKHFVSTACDAISRLAPHIFAGKQRQRKRQ